MIFLGSPGASLIFPGARKAAGLSLAAIKNCAERFPARPDPEYRAEDEVFMRLALEEAVRAFQEGEVPVGAVLVDAGEILGRGRNRPIALADPTAHAEIQALREGAARGGNYRLPGSTLYVTIEPCTMCAGAVIQARVSRLVYGAEDPKGGAVRSLFRLLEDDRLNHRVEVASGVLGEECGALLRRFFKERR